MASVAVVDEVAGETPYCAADTDKCRVCSGSSGIGSEGCEVVVLGKGCTGAWTVEDILNVFVGRGTATAGYCVSIVV